MKGNSPLLSIIVPVYNVSNYIGDCILSMKAKEGDERVQVIIVDDGSTDDSLKKCKALAINENIEVYHKENGGLASARNYGLRKAKGEYIAFVDGDDMIERDSLEGVLNNLKKQDSDVIFMNIAKFYPDGYREDMNENISKECLRKTKEEAILHLSSRNKFPASACGKIYKREFLEKEKLLFPEDGRIAEDLGFAFECVGRAAKFDKIDAPYYLYRQKRKGSITDSVSSNSFFGVALFVSEYAKQQERANKEINFRNMLGFVAYEYAILLWLYNYVKKDKKKTAKKILRENRKIMKYGQTRRLRIIRVFLSIFGISITSRLLYGVKK